MRINRDKIRKKQLKQIKNRRKSKKEKELSRKLEVLRRKINNEALPKYR